MSAMAFGKIGTKPLFKHWTARDYVQNGLVTMWDGIENAGWGVHDANAITWVDLMRPDSIEKLQANALCGMWSSDCFVNSGDRMLLWNTSYFPISASGYTFETNFSIPLVKNQAGEAVVTWRNSDNGPLCISTAWSYLRFTGGGTGNYGNDTNSYSLTQYVGKEFRAVFSQTAGRRGLFINGQNVRPDFYTSFSTSSAHKFMLSRGGQDAIRFYSVRIYSRALTASEITHNYIVDKIRFNLP